MRFDGFTSFAGTVGHYQTTDNGNIEYLANGARAGQAYGLVGPFAAKWETLGYTSNNPLGYPISNQVKGTPSCRGTSFAYQTFEGGNLTHHTSGAKSGQVFETHGAIDAKWATKGYASCPLGLPTSDESDAQPSGASGKAGRLNQFEGGQVYWIKGTSLGNSQPAFEIHGAIYETYVGMGGSASWLGFPTTDEFVSGGFARSNFEGGYITTTDGVHYQAFRYGNNCTFSVGQGTGGSEQTAFQNAYNDVGGQAALGCPTAAVRLDGFTSFAGTVGHYQTTEKGDIEYLANGPRAGQAYAVLGRIADKWALLGYTSNNPQGYPTGRLTRGTPACSGVSFEYQSFEGGTLTHHLSGAKNAQVFEVHGAIHAKWATKGFASCPLGLPTSDESDAQPSGASGKAGRLNQFEGGQVYWIKGTSLGNSQPAFEVHGSIYSTYVGMGGSASWLGFPITDEFVSGGYPRNDFEGGYITTTDGVNFRPFPYVQTPCGNADEIKQAILRVNRLLANNPPPEYLPGSSLLNFAHSFKLQAYDELYYSSFKLRGLANDTVTYASKALGRGDVASACKYLQRAERYQRLTFDTEATAVLVWQTRVNNVSDVVRSVYDGSRASLVFGLEFVGPNASLIADTAITPLDYIVDKSMYGEEEATRRSEEQIRNLFIKLIIQKLPLPQLNGKTISEYIKSGVSHQVGSSRIYSLLEEASHNPTFHQQLVKELSNLSGQLGTTAIERIATELENSFAEALQAPNGQQSMAGDNAVEMVAAAGPSVIGNSPERGAAFVSVNLSSVVVSFDKNIQAGGGAVTVSDSQGNDVPTSGASISGNNLTLSMLGGLTLGTVYKVSVPAGVVKDSAGGVNGQYSWSFTTSPPPLSAGSSVVVSNTGGPGLNLRNSPAFLSDGSNVITVLAEGTPLSVAGGPVQADGYKWWNVSGGGFNGWSAVGDWLSPSDATGLHVGSVVTVANTSGVGLRLRAEPGLQGTKITTLAEGTRMTVLSGPYYVDGYLWWNVRGDAGSGFSAVAYWLSPDVNSQAAKNLKISGVEPSALQTKDWEESVDYTVTVTDNTGNPVGGATVVGQDNLRGSVFTTAPATTNASGQVVYQTSVPAGTANTVFDISFIAQKDGFKSSQSVVRRVQVNHTITNNPVTVKIASPTTGASFNTTSNQVSLSGTAISSSGIVEVTWVNSRGGRGTASGTASWNSGSVALQPGSNIIAVAARDAAGNVGTATIDVNYSPVGTDTVGPGLTINSPADGQVVSTNSIVVSGTATDAGLGDNGVSTVTVNGAAANGGSAAGGAAANWSRSVTLQPGNNTISVVAKDNSPNQNATARAVTVTLNVTATPTPTPTPSAGADLSLAASASPNPVVVDNNVTYAGTVTNGGSTPAAGAVFVSTIPIGAGFNVVSATASRGACSVNNNSTFEVMKIDLPYSRRPDRFPPDLPLEGEITSVTQNYLAGSNRGQFQATRVFVTTRSLADAIAIYRQYITDRGWPISSSLDQDNIKSITSFTNGMSLLISAGENSITHVRSVSINLSMNGLICNLGDLPGGGSATISSVVNPTTTGTLTNQTNVFSGVGDPNLNNNSVTLDTLVLSNINAVQFSASGYNAGEGAGSADVTVIRSGDISNPAAVVYATSDGTANQRSDYTTALGTLAFAPGERSKTFKVIITDDLSAEGPETVNLELSNPTGGVALFPPDKVTLTITDNDTNTSAVNPIDGAPFYVRQHYSDFLGREPDPSGLLFWAREITGCGANLACAEVKRINVSAAFYLSIEFQQTGYLAYRAHKAAFGNIAGKPVPITRDEMLQGMQLIGGGVIVNAEGWEQKLERNKQAYFNQVAASQRFTSLYSQSLTPEQFVDALNTNAGGALSRAERDSLVAGLKSGVKTRAQALRAVAEDSELAKAEFNKAFVLMQYFGYLRRNPDALPDHDFSGWQFWLSKLNQFNGNFIQAEMVKAFLSSDEYRRRFGQ